MTISWQPHDVEIFTQAVLEKGGNYSFHEDTGVYRSVRLEACNTYKFVRFWTDGRVDALVILVSNVSEQNSAPVWLSADSESWYAALGMDYPPETVVQKDWEQKAKAAGWTPPISDY